MASKKNKARTSRDLNPRKFKKKTSVLVIEDVEYIDYKDVDLLQRFMSDRGKIRNRRVAGNTLQQQREVANAIKVAVRWACSRTPSASLPPVPVVVARVVTVGATAGARVATVVVTRPRPRPPTALPSTVSTPPAASSTA